MLFQNLGFNNYLFSLLLSVSLIVLLWYRPKTNGYVFAGLGFIMLFCMRFPVLMYNNQLNVDESQMVANLRALLHNPVYWRSIDGGTVGPAAYYFGLLSTPFQEIINYRSIRILGFIILVLNHYIFYKTLEIFVGKSVSILTTLFVGIFFTFIIHPDFLHYSSEQFPIFLLNIATLCQAKIRIKKKPDFLYFILLGITLGIIPFAKLQAIPIIAVIVVSQLIQFKNTLKKHIVFGLIIGLLAFPILLAIFLIRFNLFEDFWTFYIQDNLVYTAANKREYGVINVIKLLVKCFDFFFYWLAIGIVLIIALARNFYLITKSEIIYVFGLLIAGLFAAIITKNNFPHYLSFLVFPLGLLLGFLNKELVKTQKKYLAIPFVIFLSWTGFEEISAKKISQHLMLMKTSTEIKISPVSEYVKSIATSNDRLSVWGWQGKIYSETNILQATSENHTLHCMRKSVLQKNHIARYLANLETIKPRFIIDASQDDTALLSAIEKVPAVNDYIIKNYTLDTCISNNRIYIRIPLTFANPPRFGKGSGKKVQEIDN